VSVLEPSDALKRRNGYSEKGTSTCAWRKSPPSVSSSVCWLVQKSCIPVFRIQRPVSRFNVLRTSTLGCRASSATRPGTSIYSSHPAERSAVSTSTHCSAPQSCPRLSTAQPAPRNRLTLYTTRLSLHCFIAAYSNPQQYKPTWAKPQWGRGYWTNFFEQLLFPSCHWLVIGWHVVVVTMIVCQNR
jgi:hypothetical protein